MTSAEYAEFEKPFGPLIETTMKVLTWNIWWRFGPWEQRQPAIAETLRLVDADVISLQEVWADKSVSQADLLAGDLGFEVAYDSRREIDGFRFGNAILWGVMRCASRGSA